MIRNFWKEENKIKNLFLVDFLLYIANFLLIPIIPIYMKNILNFESLKIGFIIGIPSIICCFFSGISYICYKKLGSYKSILLSITLDIIFYVSLVIKGNFQIILIFYVLKGISNCIFMPIFKNLYMNTLKNEKNREVTFKIKYILICTAAIFAPYISKTIYPISEVMIFYIIIGINIISFMIISTYKNFIKSVEVKKTNLQISKIIVEKKELMIFLIGCIGILSVFSQFEGTFILTLNKNALDVFSVLLILNSILGIVFQIINMKFLKKLSSFHSIIIGCIFFTLSYYSFFIINENYYYLIISIILFTLGETFIIPNIDIFITEVSTNEDRIILYAISEFKRLGFFLGPFLSGYFIQKFSSSFMFVIFSIISILSCIFFIIFKKISVKKLMVEKLETNI